MGERPHLVPKPVQKFLYTNSLVEQCPLEEYTSVNECCQGTIKKDRCDPVNNYGKEEGGQRKGTSPPYVFLQNALFKSISSKCFDFCKGEYVRCVISNKVDKATKSVFLNNLF